MGQKREEAGMFSLALPQPSEKLIVRRQVADGLLSDTRANLP